MKLTIKDHSTQEGQYSNLHEIEDEFYFILVRPKYSNTRSLYIKKYY